MEVFEYEQNLTKLFRPTCVKAQKFRPRNPAKLCSSAPQPVDAPDTASGNRQVQKHRAVEHSQLAHVEYWPKPARGVLHEVGGPLLSRTGIPWNP